MTVAESAASITTCAQAWIFIRGVVIRGDQRGRTLGFATANLALPDDGMRPRDGVYAAWVHLPDDRTMRAAVSVGRRTTFYGSHGLLLAEAHLIEFDGDLYGSTITVELVGWLRDQVRFDSVDALREQLACDVLRCADVLSTLPSN